ncbi:MAG: L,D-transpeptidase family protein [Burkholderiaceae bacterium]
MAAETNRPELLCATDDRRIQHVARIGLLVAALSLPTASEAASIPCRDAGTVPAKAVLPWAGPQGLDARVPAALTMLLAAESHGLRPQDYGSTTLTRNAYRLSEAGKRSAAAIDRFNRELTASLTCYLEHLRYGSVDPKSMHPVLDTPRRVPMDATLRQAWDANDLASLETDATPSDPRYASLRAALSQLREKARVEAAQGPSGKVSAGTALRPDSDDARVASMRARLSFLGDYVEAVDLGEQSDDTRNLAEHYDPLLRAAVERFQARHGLAADGVVGPSTLAELNAPLGSRLAKIEISMERLRWLPRVENGPLVLVNLPEFKLEAGLEGDSIDLASRVVVGRSGRSETPLFAGTVTRVELNPYWNVPHDIMRDEILPKLKRDAGYLKRKNMEVVRRNRSTTQTVDAKILRELRRGQARLRQRPGAGNALGQVKFVLPNRRAIFLHDTSQRDLFARDRRDFSHGCVRVEKPIALTELMLANDPNWNQEAIAAALANARPEFIVPARPVMVALTYLTASVGQDGLIEFHPDIYGLDHKVVAQVARWNRRAEPAAEADMHLARDWVRQISDRSNAA